MLASLEQSEAGSGLDLAFRDMTPSVSDAFAATEIVSRLVTLALTDPGSGAEWVLRWLLGAGLYARRSSVATPGAGLGTGRGSLASPRSSLYRKRPPLTTE